MRSYCEIGCLKKGDKEVAIAECCFCHKAICKNEMVGGFQNSNQELFTEKCVDCYENKLKERCLVCSFERKF